VISSEILNEFEELSWEPEKIIAYNYRGMRQEPETPMSEIPPGEFPKKTAIQ